MNNNKLEAVRQSVDSSLLEVYSIDNISTDKVSYKGQSLTDIIKGSHRVKIAAYNIGKTLLTDVVVTLYDDGLFSIDGIVYIKVYDSYNNKSPWVIDSNNIKIKSVRMGNTVRPTSIKYLFNECTSLINISKLVIPDSVTNMTWLFAACSNLKDTSKLIIPNSVITMSGAFMECTSLINASKLIISNRVGDIDKLFRECSSLTGTIRLDGGSRYVDCFYKCSTKVGTNLIVNYTSAAQNRIYAIVNTKSTNSNITVGKRVS